MSASIIYCCRSTQTDALLFTLAPSEVQATTPHRNPDNCWQFPDYSPTDDDIGQIPPFPDIFIPGQDLLFGFMNENMPLAVFDINNPIF